MSAMAYALTQGGAIWHYLRLAVWPAPLVFDYGTEGAGDYAAVAGVWALVGATAWRCAVAAAAGFLGFLFFAGVAPSLSFVPVATQTMAEHRMYLPLAALVVAAVLGAYRRGVFGLVVVALAGGWGRGCELTTGASGRSGRIPSQSARGNARAHFNLGVALSAGGDEAGEGGRVAEALRIEPAHVPAHAKLAESLAQSGQVGEALGHFEAAARGGRGDGFFLNNWGSALLAKAGGEGAGENCRGAGAAAGFGGGAVQRGNALVALGRGAEATGSFSRGGAVAGRLRGGALQPRCCAERRGSIGRPSPNLKTASPIGAGRRIGATKCSCAAG